MPSHRDLRRQTTRALRRDRNAYWKAIAEETERAAACSDTRKLYQTLKSVNHRPAEVGEALLERNGSVIPDKARTRCRWKEHFKVLLKRAALSNTTFSPPDYPAADLYPREVDPPSLEEMCTASRQSSNYRTRGEEVHKTCLDSQGPWMHRVITEVWLCDVVPNT